MDEKVPGELKALLEALLFASPSPLSTKRICEIVSTVDSAQVRHTLSVLRREMSQSNRGIELVRAAGGWRIQTKPEFKDKVRMLVQKPPQRLSRAALETLAVIAYKQPVTRVEIEQARGVDSSATIRYLLDKRLIRIIGRKDVPGRPLIYGTTKRFLEVFQLNDLSALPSHRELKPAGNERQARLFDLNELRKNDG